MLFNIIRLHIFCSFYSFFGLNCSLYFTLMHFSQPCPCSSSPACSFFLLSWFENNSNASSSNRLHYLRVTSQFVLNCCSWDLCVETAFERLMSSGKRLCGGDIERASGRDTCLSLDAQQLRRRRAGAERVTRPLEVVSSLARSNRSLADASQLGAR